MVEEIGKWSKKTDSQIIKKLIKVTGDTEEELNKFRVEKGWSWDLLYQVIVLDA